MTLTLTPCRVLSVLVLEHAVDGHWWACVWQLAMLREDVLNEDFFDEAQGSSGQSKTLTRLPPKPQSYLDQVVNQFPHHYLFSS